MEEESDPPMGPWDIKAEVSDPTTGGDDKKGIVLCGDANGDAAGLYGKVLRLGSSVPMCILSTDQLVIAIFP